MKKVSLFIIITMAITFGVYAQGYTTLGIGITNPQGTLHVHSAVPTNPVIPVDPPRDNFQDNYETVIRLTNPNTGSTTNDGFVIGMMDDDMVMRSFEHGDIKLKVKNGSQMLISPSGNVGIGDTLWGVKFNVEGTSRLAGNTAVTGTLNVSGASTFGNTLSVGGGFTATTTGSAHADLQFTVGDNNSYVHMNAYGNVIASNNVDVGGKITAGGNITSSGNLVVTGTARLGNGFYCDAQGNVKVKELRVTLTDWPDYVFDAGYRLMPLSEVEGYIAENGHLPQMPSAEEVEQDGADLGEMNKLLLQKVEELTLYVIDLQRQIEELKSN
ncbi:MAG: hypothetical protein IKR33_06655 [Bacteroidales bacterium]|nr:hypothetical protein [Bacteroidales bacterium]